MLCCVVLCCVVLCCVVLCCVVLGCCVLCCAVLCCVVLCYVSCYVVVYDHLDNNYQIACEFVFKWNLSAFIQL